VNYFVIAVLTVPALACAYLGWRLRWAFGGVLPPWFLTWYVFWPVVALAFMSFPLTHFLSRLLGVVPPSWLLLATAALFGTLAIGVVTALMADVLGLIARGLPFLQGARAYAGQHRHYFGLLLLGCVALQVAWGVYNANVPRETYYSPVIHKPLQNGARRLRIVQISDLHVSHYSSVALMRETVARVNRLQPDLIVITGDIIDISARPYFEQDMPRILGELKSRYGVYAILSNHDYYGDSPKINAEAYAGSGMRVLRDAVLYLREPGITLIGRDDTMRGARRLPPGAVPDLSSPRAPLASLTARADPATPWILLDHQPSAIGEAIAQKIDLQFSGHTHNGQIFPANFIVKALYKKPWGIFKQGDFSLIVTCGVGTWGPPLRFPSYAEIVVADVVFQKP